MAVTFLLILLSLCIGFYSILSVSRYAPGSCFYLVFSFFGVFLIVAVLIWEGCYFFLFGGGA